MIVVTAHFSLAGWLDWLVGPPAVVAVSFFIRSKKKSMQRLRLRLGPEIKINVFLDIYFINKRIDKLHSTVPTYLPLSQCLAYIYMYVRVMLDRQVYIHITHTYIHSSAYGFYPSAPSGSISADKSRTYHTYDRSNQLTWSNVAVRNKKSATTTHHHHYHHHTHIHRNETR